MIIDSKDLRFWDDQNNKWKLEAGDFDLMVGSSSADIRLMGNLQPDNNFPLHTLPRNIVVSAGNLLNSLSQIELRGFTFV